MRPKSELEPKFVSMEMDRPFSWGDHVEQRRQRRRAGRGGRVSGLARRGVNRVFELLRSLGMIHRKRVVEGVVYRELSNVSLRRALLSGGVGVKEYEVRFPSRGSSMKSQQYPMRESMRIRYTNKRIYADLGHDPRIRFYELLSEHIHPGHRLVEIGCGSGGGSTRLGELVGPSGGVVAIHRDGESVRFARQRYRLDHLAFELGWLESLEGELDGAFDGAIVVDLFRDAPDDPSKSRAIGSLWRVVGDGGLIGVICTDRNQLDQVTDRLSVMGLESLTVLEPDPVLLWGGAFGFRPSADDGSAAR